jgi:hypothetical protein
MPVVVGRKADTARSLRAGDSFSTARPTIKGSDGSEEQCKKLCWYCMAGSKVASVRKEQSIFFGSNANGFRAYRPPTFRSNVSVAWRADLTIYYTHSLSETVTRRMTNNLLAATTVTMHGVKIRYCTHFWISEPFNIHAGVEIVNQDPQSLTPKKRHRRGRDIQATYIGYRTQSKLPPTPMTNILNNNVVRCQKTG